MAFTCPVINRYFDTKALELLVMAVAHSDVLNVENYQWWSAHRPNSTDLSHRLLLLMLRLGCCILIDDIDLLKLTGCWCNLLLLGVSLKVAPTSILTIIVSTAL